MDNDSETPFDFNTPILKDTTLNAKWESAEEGHSLANFKSALDKGNAESIFPVGSQIDDYTNGIYDPWIVGYYGEEYGDSEVTGAYLYRKYITPIDKAWGTSGSYNGSDVDTYLKTTYLNGCSDEIKDLIKEISLPSGGTFSMFLMSGTETMSVSDDDGVEWDGWKTRTGLSSPSTTANGGRKMAKGYLSGDGEVWRLRSQYAIEGNGSCQAIGSSVEAGIVPACFIPATELDWDPDNPTIKGLKYALDNNIEVAIGTEIPDILDGFNNPLIVAHHLTGSERSSYNNAPEGYFLVRKYVYPTSGNYSTVGPDYATSAIKGYLDTDYLDLCSNELKEYISDINIPVYNASVKSKWFLLSAYEVCNKGAGLYEGVMWSLFKQRTGLSVPDSFNTTNAGRIIRNVNGGSLSGWLRTRYSTTQVTRINGSGGVAAEGYNDYNGIFPACFVGKN